MQNSPGFVKQEHSAQIEATELTPPPAGSESAMFDENINKNENLLSKADLHHKINMNPDALTYLVPSHTKSAVWSKHDFRFIIYNDVKQKFVICMNCRSILSYTGESNLQEHNFLTDSFMEFPSRPDRNGVTFASQM
jgi:hypothetical protein